MAMDLETRIKKSHVTLMRHHETALYSGVMMMGKTWVEDSKITAYTNGVDKAYGREFMSKLDDAEVNGVVLHENLHVALRHMIHNLDLFKENRKLANMAADYVVNGIILNLKDQNLCKLPKGHLHDPRFKDMSMREIYRILKKEQEEEEKEKEKGKPCDSGDGGSGDGETNQDDGSDSKGDSGSFDEHDVDSISASTEELKKISEAVDKALREGGILAGRMGAKIPRAIDESLEPVVDWRRVLNDFITSTTRGNEEYTWRRYNRKLIDTMIMPTTENEKLSEVIIAIDTSGSIGAKQLSEFAAELAAICSSVQPDTVRVLWWDTMVQSEQVFTEKFENIKTLLKPAGGGGTRVSSVSKYIEKKKYSPDAVVVFTDGYVESPIEWGVSVPTLWLVTHEKNRPFPGTVVPFN